MEESKDETVDVQIELELEIKETKAEIQKTKAEIRDVETKIQDVGTKIQKFDTEIQKFDTEIKNILLGSTESEDNYERLIARPKMLKNLTLDQKNQLRDEEERLRDKERQLRDKERQLREKIAQLVKEHDQLHNRRLPTVDENSAISPEVIESLTARMDDTMAKYFNNRATPQLTPSSHGRNVMKKLESLKKVTFFKGDDGDPVIGPNDVKNIPNTFSSEHHLVAVMTEYLEAAIGEGVVLVNSQEQKWLVAGDDERYSQKPDMFVCHEALYKSKRPFDATSQPKVRDSRKGSEKFGVLADWRLRSHLGAVLKAKANIGSSHSGFGEICNYAAHISQSDGPVHVHMILFDKNEFWLVPCVKGHPTNVTKCPWTRGGSKKLLRDFVLEDPLSSCLTEACSGQNLTVEKNAFLGKGATGVVFRVTCNKTKQHRALKIVPNEDRNWKIFRDEIQTSIHAKEKCPDHVIGHDGNSFQDYGAYMTSQLSEVGEPYHSLNSLNEANIDIRETLNESLQVLHNAGLIHGDARVENVVVVDGAPRWIDLLHVMVFESDWERMTLRKLDFDTLNQSLDHHLGSDGKFKKLASHF